MQGDPKAFGRTVANGTKKDAHVCRRDSPLWLSVGLPDPCCLALMIHNEYPVRMAMMLSRTYEALKAAGAPDDKAREAAEEIAGFENRLISIDNRLSRLEAQFSMLQWMVGITLAATLAVLWRVFAT